MVLTLLASASLLNSDLCPRSRFRSSSTTESKFWRPTSSTFLPLFFAALVLSVCDYHQFLYSRAHQKCGFLQLLQTVRFYRWFFTILMCNLFARSSLRLIDPLTPTIKQRIIILSEVATLLSAQDVSIICMKVSVNYQKMALLVFDIWNILCTLAK